MWTVTSVTNAVIKIESTLKRSLKMQNLSNNHCKKSSQQTIEQKVVILRTPEFRQESPLRRNHIATRRIKEGERLQNACHSQRFNQNQIPAQIWYLWFGLFKLYLPRKETFPMSIAREIFVKFR